MQKIMTITLIFLFPDLALAQEDNAPVFFCSAVPNQDLAANIVRFRPFTDYLERKLGIAVRYVPTASYETTVEAFARHEVHLAWFGGLTGVLARRLSPGAEAIAQGAEDRDFKSYFIANAKSGLARSWGIPDALKGKSFTFGSRVSTSGRLMPEFFIRQNFGGMAPEKVFSRVGFAGDHLGTLAAVQSGEFDAGALDYKVYEAEKRAGRVDDSKVVVIWETPPYPDYQFTIQGDFDVVFGKGFKEKVKRAILELEDRKILDKFQRSSFVPASNGQYQQIEEVLQQSSELRKLAGAASPLSR
jgi:phosphonate transport system substrate-binding protein